MSSRGGSTWSFDSFQNSKVITKTVPQQIGNKSAVILRNNKNLLFHIQPFRYLEICAEKQLLLRLVYSKNLTVGSGIAGSLRYLWNRSRFISQQISFTHVVGLSRETAFFTNRARITERKQNTVSDELLE